MNLKITLKGLPETGGRLQELERRMGDLNPLIQRISVMELASAQGRIEAGGPGWPATAEQSFGTALNRTGGLLRSLTRGGPENLWEEIPRGLRIGTSMQTDDGYNIGRMMQYGTGVYGRGSPITPTHAKYLKFRINGQWRSVREVQGAPPRAFLFVDSSDAERALGIARSFILSQGTS